MAKVNVVVKSQTVDNIDFIKVTLDKNTTQITYCSRTKIPHTPIQIILTPSLAKALLQGLQNAL